MKLVTTSASYNAVQNNKEEVDKLLEKVLGNSSYSYGLMTLTETEYLDNYKLLDAPIFVRTV